MRQTYIRSCTACEAVPKKQTTPLKTPQIICISTGVSSTTEFPETVTTSVSLEITRLSSPVSASTLFEGKECSPCFLYAPPFLTPKELHGRVASIKGEITAIHHATLKVEKSIVFEKTFETTLNSIREEKIIFKNKLVEKESQAIKFYPYGGFVSETESEQLFVALSIQKHKTIAHYYLASEIMSSPPPSLQEEIRNGAYSVELISDTQNQNYITQSIEFFKDNQAKITLKRKDTTHV